MSTPAHLWLEDENGSPIGRNHRNTQRFPVGKMKNWI